MSANSKLQRRVFAVFGGFTLLLCLIFFAICLLAAYVIEDQLLDNLLEGEVRYIEQQLQLHGRLPEPRLPYLTLYTDPEVVPAGLLGALPGDTVRAEWFSDAEHHFHLRRILQPDGGRAILAAEVSGLLTVTRQSTKLLWLFGAACIVTMLLALWCAYRISCKTIAPVIALAEAIRRQKSLGSQVHLPHSGDDDEVGYLAATLEQTINQLKQALQRETEFTRDTSHELRTALTVVRGTLTLCQQREMTAAEREELLQTVADMEETVATLLALARSESLQRQAFEVRPLLEERLLARHREITGANFRVCLSLGRDVRIVANRHLVSLLFDNLIGNALQHASTPKLRICSAGDSLLFENSIADDFDASSSLLPGHRGSGSRGIGQGLFLAKRICCALDWEITVRCHRGIYQCRISRLNPPATDRSQQENLTWISPAGH
ncbi:HAMP domain-containing sensor histidine kinase [Microbulbifer sp. 2201CG32-9]|uniref:HAMP domain-containing sensor histidine kinase n=1 Tax=Microbulbifer sp. 2201CG32-9 TaxID=3232309 RepID=UPI00345C490C